MMSWVLHRVSGLALSAYLLLHIWNLRVAQRGAAAFDEALAGLQSPFWKVMNLLVLLVALYHTLNGIRLLLFDAGTGLRHQRQLFWVAFVLTLAIFLFSSVMVISNLPGAEAAP